LIVDPVPLVESVFHPSDFSESSDAAFAHALAIALLRKTRLTLLHAARDIPDGNEWTKFPGVRATLERWGYLEPGSPRSAVFDELALRVKKVRLRRRSPLAAIQEYLGKHPTDLVVLATEGREGAPSWLRPSVAERVARATSSMTLFVPNACRGFVSLEDGGISLQRILVPITSSPSPVAAIAFAARAADLVDEPLEVVLLHVGEEDGFPQILLPESSGCHFRQEVRSGSVVPEIERAAKEFDVDLIVMATDGPDGFLGALKGSHTEQVVRRAPCPVLGVPEVMDDASG
jgi:nucleotide-binding universal stress UspA family protein